MACSQANMEEIFSRFPHIAENIMGRLDNAHLTECRVVDNFWRSFIDNQKLLWMRIIFESVKSSHYQEWREISRKLNINLVRILGKTAYQFCTDGEDIEEINHHNPIVIAAVTGNTEIVTKVFQKDIFDYQKGIPFQYSAKYGNLEVCRFFIKNTDNKNPKDDEGETPLHIAAKNGKFQVCQMIFEAGIDDKNPKASEYIDGFTPLHLAAANNHLSVCHLIIKNNLDANPKDSQKRTPLHYAAMKGHSEVYRFILSKVKEKHPRDELGDTPLHDAAKYGHLEVCEIILEDMEKSNRVFPSYGRNEDGQTPLDLSIEEGYEEIYNFLKLCEDLSELISNSTHYSE